MGPILLMRRGDNDMPRFLESANKHAAARCTPCIHLAIDHLENGPLGTSQQGAPRIEADCLVAEGPLGLLVRSCFSFDAMQQVGLLLLAKGPIHVAKLGHLRHLHLLQTPLLACGTAAFLCTRDHLLYPFAAFSIDCISRTLLGCALAAGCSQDVGP